MEETPLTTPLQRGMKEHFPAVILIVLAGLAVYARALGHDFLEYDDRIYVVSNDVVRGISWANISRAFSSFYLGNYAPLHILSYMLDHALWGMNAFGYILQNIVLHILNAVLLYLLVQRTLRSRSAALFAAIFFVVHPVNVESVAWIAERKNVLAMFFYLASFLLYAVSRERTGKLLYWCAFLSFLFSLLTKQVGIALPAILLLYDVMLRQEPLRQALRRAAPFAAVALLAAFVAIFAQSPEYQGGRVPFHARGIASTIFTMVPVAVKYLRMVVWPTGLTVNYTPVIRMQPDAQVLLCAFFLAVVGTLLVVRRRNDRQAVFFSLVFFLHLLPVLNIIPLVTIMNDRYLYFSFSGAAPLAGMFLAAVKLPRLAKGVAALSVCLALGFLASRRVEVWRDDVSLWSDALRKDPANEQNHIFLGLNYAMKGRVAEAIDAYRHALQINPRNREGLEELPPLYTRNGEPQKGEPYLLTLVTAYPTYVKGWLHLAELYYMLGKVGEAEDAFRKAFEINPDSSGALNGLGIIMLDRKQFDQAEDYLLSALRFAGRDERQGVLFNLACLESARGDVGASLDYLRQALAEGFNDMQAVERNPDLERLRQSPEFGRLFRR